MGRKYQVISADGHVETTPERWVHHVPERWRDRAPRLISLPEGGDAWVIEGLPLLHTGKNLTAGGPIRLSHASYHDADGNPVEGAGGPEQRLREQDLDGVDAEVLFPPVYATRFLEGIGDRDVYTSMVQAYNTFLAEDYCSVAPDRLIGNGTMPVTGIDDAVAELRRVHQLGLPSVSFHQFPNGSGSPSPEDDRFWSTALELGVALSPHFAFGDRDPATSAAVNPRRALAAEMQSAAGRHAPVYCMAQLMLAGVFDRFPEIRFYFAECNGGWLPFTLHFLDARFEQMRAAYDVKLELRPSEYVLRHCRFGLVTDPVAVSLTDRIPAEVLMWGSDFPHSAGSYPRSRETLDEMFAGVDPGVRRQILLETPASYFGLDLDADLTPTPA